MKINTASTYQTAVGDYIDQTECNFSLENSYLQKILPECSDLQHIVLITINR